MSKSRRLQLTTLTGGLLFASVLAGCGHAPSTPGAIGNSQAPDAPASTASAPSVTTAPTTPTTPATPTTPPVSFRTNVKDGASKVKVDTLVSVKASAGTLSKVTLAYTYTDRQGKAQKGKLRGAVNKAKTAWTAAERLEPAADYKLTMVGKNKVKQATTATSAFRTTNLTLAQQTFPTLYPLRGMKVGVGMPVVLTFDVAVQNKKEVQKNLSVTSTSKQAGSWRWFSDREVHFRPKTYWKPGTKISVDANLNGVNAGGGIYGQNSASTSFTVGSSLITKINLQTDRAKVYAGGKLVRTIGVSGGKPGWQSRSGVKLIMDKELTHKMTNEMIGAKEDYDLDVKYAMRITNSGEFLHAAPWNAANLGVRNASHGCVGMSTGDAAWLYSRVKVGDPVVTTGTSRGLEQGNGYADWNISYAQYKKGSAI